MSTGLRGVQATASRRQNVKVVVGFKGINFILLLFVGTVIWNYDLNDLMMDYDLNARAEYCSKAFCCGVIHSYHFFTAYDLNDLMMDYDLNARA